MTGTTTSVANVYPIVRPRPDPMKYFGVPKPNTPGKGPMVCPTENRLTLWEYLPDEMLRCDECGRTMSREEVT